MLFVVFNAENMERVPYSEMKIEELKARIEILRSLCDQVDPYLPLNPMAQKRLRELKIDLLDDPFALTNQLLLLMEDALEELSLRSSSMN